MRADPARERGSRRSSPSERAAQSPTTPWWMETLSLDPSLMRDVWVDLEAGVARAKAGLTWGELDREAQAFGLAVTGAHSGRRDGLERKTGFTPNLISANVVIADGQCK